MSARTSLRRLGAVAALVTIAVGLAGCDDPPTTVQTTLTEPCAIKSNNFLVPDGDGSTTSTFTVTAPQAVKPGGQLTITVASPPFTIDGSSTSSGTVTQISNVVSKLTIPANTTLVSQSISGWSNVGSGTPTSTVSGNAISITVPGPIAANVSATLPKLTMVLEATGAAGSRIDLKAAGTSTGSPGLTFGARVTGTLVGTLNPTFSCYPSPNPVLHSTLISTDTKAPVITITSPAANQSIPQGATVAAAYSCDDGTGVGVASCTGTVPVGAAIDTSSPGTKTFTVTAADNEGKVSTSSVTYTVTAP